LCRAYNQVMERLRSDDWACFIDHDAMWTTYDWYPQIEEYIVKYPDAGLFVAMSSRNGIPAQVPGAVHSKQKLRRYGRNVYTIPGNSHDMRFHRTLGEDIQTEFRTDVIDYTDEITTGVVMVTSKETWELAGGFNESRPNLGGCDSDYHYAMAKIGKRVYIMKGVYVYHWYREDGHEH